jgi:excisionase family DNA binding protein
METRQTSLEPTHWMTVDETAKYLSLSRATIYQYVREARIPYIKVPGSNQIRFSRHDIDAWMSKGAVATVAEQLAGG